MPLASGTRIQHFEIVSSLGAGGMGEVYRARDTDLDRDVALKILPQAFAGDSERMLRFEREAKTLAALNHPNIAHIHGVAREGSTRALVMELVDGTTLDRATFAIDEALRIVRDIAEALEYAHERGVVHRDLKPANVMLSTEGAVKVLDFGLARAVASDDRSSGGFGSQDSPTLTSPAMTGIGTILGTAAYMAPEQAKGKPVDRRADIWALGVILFEMLAGRTVYSGETVTETIAQVITQPPDWSALPAGTPPSVRRLLRRCLEKEPRARYQSAGDVRVEIEEIQRGDAEPSSAVAAVAHQPSAPWIRYLPWAVTVILAAVLAAVVARSWRQPTIDPAPTRLDIRFASADLAPDSNGDASLIALSRDGRTLAYAGGSAQARRLYVRSFDSVAERMLTGTDEAASHTFSPDGRWLAFWGGRSIKKVAIAGGDPVQIAPAVEARGVAWGEGDIIVYAPATTEGLFKVAATGGEPVQLTRLEGNERTHRWPHFLPGGKTVLFVCQLATASYDDATIEAVRVDEKSPQRKVIVRGGSYPQYLASGHLTFMRAGTLFVVPFDAERVEASGEPQPVLNGVGYHIGVGGGAGNGAGQIAVAPGGTVVYLGGGGTSMHSRIVVTDRGGKELHATTERAELRAPHFSPNGREIAYDMRAGQSMNIKVWNPVSGAVRQVTHERSVASFPVWSPDGQHLAILSDRASQLTVYLTRSDGVGEPRRLSDAKLLRIPTSFHPDGKTIAIMEQNKAGFDVLLAGLDGSSRPFAATPAQEMMAAFSRDGRWIAYQSDESGRPEVYVRPAGGGTERWLISAGGGGQPVWTAAGRELIYLGGKLPDVQVMSVPIGPGGETFEYGAPKPLFATTVSQLTNTIYMDVSPDGSRFALLKDANDTARSGSRYATLILNFDAEVRAALGQRR